MGAISERALIATENSQKIDAFLQSIRKAVIGRGGDIPLTAGLAELSSAIFDIPTGSAISSSIDEGTAYVKDIPEDVTRYALLSKIGGRTRKCTNLLPSTSVYGYIDSSGVYQSGTIPINQSTLDYIAVSGNVTIHAKDIMYTIGLAWYDSDKVFLFREQWQNTKEATSAVPENAKYLRAFANKDNSRTTEWSFMSVEMALNEGETALPYEPYFEGLRSAPVTETKSFGVDGNVIDTRSVPEAVQALDGYGWGVNESVYNYIDYEKKQFVKCVGAVDMGTLDFIYYSTAPKVLFETRSLKDVIKPTAGDVCANVLSANHPVKPAFETNGSNTSNGIGANESGRVFIKDINYEDIESFKAAMAGVMLYYELAEPVITDISDILTDNLIGVEGGGSLEFMNEHNYDIPSTIKYTAKAGE